MSNLIARLKSPLVLIIGGLMVLRLITAARAGLVPDESYYWLWAQHPAAGYYDHPPMVAWWIAAFTALNDAALMVRLPFVLSFVALSWLMFDAARVMFSDAVARRTLLWLNACLLLSVGSVIATPDPPSVLMWACGLWALARLQTSGRGIWWLAFGLFAGLGVEAKYTNLFLGLGVLAWFALDKPARRWLLTPWPWLGAAIAGAAMAPNLIWNAQHDWLTFTKQFGRIEAGHLTAKYLIEFLISQPLLLNPFIAAFVGLGVATWVRTRNDSRLALLVALPLPLLAYMLIHVFHDRIQGNWPAPIYPGLVLLAAAAAEGTEKLRWARTWAAPFGVGISVMVLAYLALGPQLPGAAGLSQGWNAVSQSVAARQAETGAGWIATTDYNTQGELSYHLPERPVVGMAERDRYQWPAPANLTRQRALIVTAAGDTPDLARCFSDLKDLGAVSRLKKPGKKSDFQLHTGLLKSPECETD
ncbi:ArnT family glycosyltransferase [Asticcacaulis sp. 201]|uniref:ArnT family glycosyltransferase n=1 Tax=Asticcacaulis sp. 201 TaxID=3028787 RepID=UPI002916E0B0|nr:glycosyltransferase family 39 protein [Asticcacaulis sp. 201]MDV6332731.1 glycosyltransferase family 39 protein [Asticcacaulis sp. 201]